LIFDKILKSDFNTGHSNNFDMPDSPIPDLSTVASPPRQSVSYASLQTSEEPIGAGGDAVVYMATLPSGDTPTRVAIKEPDQSGSLSRETIEQFLKEADTWEGRVNLVVSPVAVWRFGVSQRRDLVHTGSAERPVFDSLHGSILYPIIWK